MTVPGGLLDSVGRNLWAASEQAAVLVVLVWLVTLACRKAPPAVRYGLWCVVLVRLCLPISLSLPVGAMDEFRASVRWMLPTRATAAPAPTRAPGSSPQEQVLPASRLTPPPEAPNLTSSPAKARDPVVTDA